jgi:hypothetical protein
MIEAIRAFMTDGKMDSVIHEIDAPDIPLWCMWTILQYMEATSYDQGFKLYGKFYLELLDTIMEGNYPNLQLHSNGLVYS